ncbi:MAG: hypothetical protein RIK87_26765 [Fuerstiella sp.]
MSDADKKTQPSQCGGLPGAVKDTLVLVLETTGSTVLDSPKLIEKILSDPKVRQAIEKTALEEAKALTKKQVTGKTVSMDDILASAGKVGKATIDPATQAGKTALEKSQQVRRLKEGLRQLECSYRKSTVGVFVDKNKGWLILVGAGLGLGGAAAMYKFKTGDAFAMPATKLASHLVRFKVLGNVEIAAKDIKFEPSKQLVGATKLTKIKWDKVDVDLELSVTAENEKLKQAVGKGSVAVEVAKGVKVGLSAGGGYVQPATGWERSAVYDLRLKFSTNKTFGQSRLSVSAEAFATQEPTQFQWGGKADAKYHLVGRPGSTDPSLSLSLSAQANELTTYTPHGETSSKTGVSFGLGFSANF